MHILYPSVAEFNNQEVPAIVFLYESKTRLVVNILGPSHIRLISQFTRVRISIWTCA